MPDAATFPSLKIFCWSLACAWFEGHVTRSWFRNNRRQGLAEDALGEGRGRETGKMMSQAQSSRTVSRMPVPEACTSQFWERSRRAVGQRSPWIEADGFSSAFPARLELSVSVVPRLGGGGNHATSGCNGNTLSGHVAVSSHVWEQAYLVSIAKPATPAQAGGHLVSVR